MLDPPKLDAVREAADRLRGIALHTPLVPLHNHDHRDDILLKPEIHQPVTSFKIRGIYNAVALLTPESRARGLSTVSAGNTAQALAWTARRFNVTARAVMPDTAPVTKIEAVKHYGGQPVLVPTEEVFRFLKGHAWENEPYAFIHPWTNPDVMTGHGTIGLEIMTDGPDVDSVYVPVGGGGLIGGVGAAIKALNPHVRVIAVEPEGCPALYESFKQNRPAAVDCRTLCDGVAVPYITDEVFPVLRRVVDDVALVSESAVKQTIKRLALGNRLIVEGSAALSVAAALADGAADRGRCVCILTGGSIDLDKLLPILSS